MPVQTEAQFKAATRLQAKGLRQGKLRDIRSSRIKPIDRALATYDLVRASHNLGQKSQALQAVLGACASWLKAKMGKVSTNSGNRRPVILALAQDAFNDLKTMQRARGVDFYNLNKSLTTGNQTNYQLKGLSNGYTHERTGYLSNGKTGKPLSGSYVHEGMTNIRNLGIGNNYANNQKLQNALNKSFGNLTPSDYNLIADAYSDALLSQNRGVHFSNKEERSAELMVVYPGYTVDFENINGGPFDTIMHGTFDPDAGYMYAMDDYGTLFASPPEGLAKGGDFWNHSSFNAGKDVVCAGVIRIHNGVLQFVDNNSGHYKPSRHNLFELLTVFQAEGIPLNNVAVQIREPSHVPNSMDVHSLTAVNFLADVNAMDPNVQVIPA